MRFRPIWQRLKEGARLMVGVPDYDRYVAHMRFAHPEITPLSREAFVQGRMEARYGGKGSGKCPC
ncbi:MAG TPA: CstA-like transporter-associated (seleno)protein [Moraxellaceae bacterium]|nr:CstA-like transporter-associated (seleno)protein [Moraxellaceae bacterium]